jgi:hypothetical protein
MSEKKMSKAETLALAHAANRRKRLNRLADELRENGFFVLTPEEAAATKPKRKPELPKAA